MIMFAAGLLSAMPASAEETLGKKELDAVSAGTTSVLGFGFSITSFLRRGELSVTVTQDFTPPADTIVSLPQLPAPVPVVQPVFPSDLKLPQPVTLPDLVTLPAPLTLLPQVSLPVPGAIPGQPGLGNPAGSISVNSQATYSGAGNSSVTSTALISGTGASGTASVIFTDALGSLPDPIFDASTKIDTPQTGLVTGTTTLDFSAPGTITAGSSVFVPLSPQQSVIVGLPESPFPSGSDNLGGFVFGGP
jgi:hypothetical protein